MVANKAIDYAPQCGDLTVKSLIFQTNNVVVIAYDLNPPTDDFVARPLKEFLIKFTAMNGKKPLTLDFNTISTSTGLDYNNADYVAHPSPEAIKSLPGILSNSNFSKDPSKVKKKVKSKTVTPNLPKLQGPEASGAPFKKRNKPMPINTTLKTQATPPNVPTKDSEKTHSVSSRQTAHLLDTEENIQSAVKGFHSSPNEGNRGSKPLPEGKSTDAKDPEGNIQPVRMGLPSTSLDEGIRKS
nr:hypothetical protein [Tanacetum cinerariifolium]